MLTSVAERLRLEWADSSMRPVSRLGSILLLTWTPSSPPLLPTSMIRSALSAEFTSVKRCQSPRVVRIVSYGMLLPSVRRMNTFLADVSRAVVVWNFGGVFFSAEGACPGFAGCWSDFCSPNATGTTISAKKSRQAEGNFGMAKLLMRTAADCSAAALGSPCQLRPFAHLTGSGDYNSVLVMADRLYLSIWFPSFSTQEMLPRLLSVVKQFPFSSQRGGIGYLAVHSISWEEPVVFQQTFDERAEPDVVLALAAEFLNEDNAYEIEVMWDL